MEKIPFFYYLKPKKDKKVQIFGGMIKTVLQIFRNHILQNYFLQIIFRTKKSFRAGKSFKIIKLVRI